MKSASLKQIGEQKVAIVTTLRSPGSLLEPFLSYHLEIGFNHIFLFFDDPHDAAIPSAEKYRNVTIIKNDTALQEKWRNTYSYRQDELIRRHIEEEVMARQSLNVEVAVELAMEMQFDWLLHIDIDELFFSEKYTVQEHFQRLTDIGIKKVRYINYEALPERADITDPFKEVTLFKKNPELFRQDRRHREYEKILDRPPKLSPGFFFYYKNGKAAARLSGDLRSSGVHDYSLPEERRASVSIHRGVINSAIARGVMKLNPQLVRWIFQRTSPMRKFALVSDDPIILHYPSCSFELFWNKYSILGRFPDKWFGEVEIAKTMPFHIKSRNVMTNGSKELARDFYQKHVVMDDPELLNQLLELGLLHRIDTPSRLLHRPGLITGTALESIEIETGSNSYATASI